jgi:hypothetical protein
VSRPFRTARLLLVPAIAAPLSTGVLGVATPAYARPPSDVLATAEDEVGTPEGSARADSYGAAVGLSQSTRTYAWCAVFVSWVVEGSDASGFRSASVGDWVAAADADDYGLSVTEDPRPGDLVAFDWDGDGDYASPDRHIGVVASVPDDDGTFTTVEGNTILPSGGQGVAERERSTDAGYSTLFIRIDVRSGAAAGPTTVNSDPAS